MSEHIKRIELKKTERGTFICVDVIDGERLLGKFANQDFTNYNWVFLSMLLRYTDAQYRLIGEKYIEILKETELSERYGYQPPITKEPTQ